MSARRACLRHGHKFRAIVGVPLPYVFCARLGCTVCAVAPWVPPGIAADLYDAIPEPDRYPAPEAAS